MRRQRSFFLLLETPPFPGGDIPFFARKIDAEEVYALPLALVLFPIAPLFNLFDGGLAAITLNSIM
jgi:hypothetical protein